VTPGVPIEETVGAMARPGAQGKVRFLGFGGRAYTVRRAAKVHPIAAFCNPNTRSGPEHQRKVEVLPHAANWASGVWRIARWDAGLRENSASKKLRCR